MRIQELFFATLVVAFATVSYAQTVEEGAKKRWSELTLELSNVPQWLKTFNFEQTKFTFVRIRYDSLNYRGGRQRADWSTDYPDADMNFASQVGKFTGLDVTEPAIVLRLTDPELKKYPFIYIAEPSSMSLSSDERKALREYLTGGGFLLLDDFWGAAELEDVRFALNCVFPDRKPRELPLEHPLFHCVFDLKEKPQVPSIHEYLARSRLVKDHAPEYYGIEDDKGRVMVLMCHNTDLADGWERAGEDATYKREMSEAKAFPMGFNILYYALTHGKTKVAEK